MRSRQAWFSDLEDLPDQSCIYAITCVGLGTDFDPIGPGLA